jgi:hypothetical protein
MHISTTWLFWVGLDSLKSRPQLFHLKKTANLGGGIKQRQCL